MTQNQSSHYSIFYYISPMGDNPIKQFLDSLSKRQQVKILRIFQYMKEYGLSAILPHIKKVTGTPFWEIRILGKDNLRVFYAVPSRNSILILHGFIKKSEKTPMKELQTALKRYEEWKKSQGKPRQP